MVSFKIHFILNSRDPDALIYEKWLYIRRFPSYDGANIFMRPPTLLIYIRKQCIFLSRIANHMFSVVSVCQVIVDL
jgi:hypothetical protein